ncbi:MAG: ATP-binding cassette domain-containing protein [Clostridia bacterium]|nr:ATP-binding cassette domain-containing protein [Clostridia bacterium]
MDDGVLLQMSRISKSFPGVRALDGASLTLKRGSVHALMGENGAGKSTLMKCLFGIYAMDEGEITLNGAPVSFKSSKEALEQGVAMVHQELNQALKRSVADNLWLGRYPTRWGVVNERKMQKDTKALFDDLGISTDPKAIMETLSVSKRQMVEIAKAVSYGAKVIVFDEPTSSLTEEEAEQLFRIIRRLRDDGCGIVYISHKMEEILRICDTVTVMRDGKTVATEDAKHLTTDAIIRLMVGRELTQRFPPKENTPAETVLTVRGLTGKHSILRDVSFDLRKGEILGVAGLDGSGRTEVLEALFGLSEKSAKALILEGRSIENKTPRQAIANGFALVTEERRATGIFGIRSITENTVISNLRNYLRGFWLSQGAMKRDTEQIISSLRVKTPSAATPIRALSGGNQQKVIFGRWLLTKPKILLLDEPTRGIDVGAKYEIYQIITDLAKQGRSVIMVSGEMPELLGICDRIMVLSGGRVAGFAERDATQEQIMTLAAKYV